jgi:hypothetical protein
MLSPVPTSQIVSAAAQFGARAATGELRDDPVRRLAPPPSSDSAADRSVGGAPRVEVIGPRPITAVDVPFSGGRTSGLISGEGIAISQANRGGEGASPQAANAQAGNAQAGNAQAAENGEGAEASEIGGGARGADGEVLSEEEQKVVDDLKARDAEVRRHEQAHAAAGGPYAGAPSYTYQQGPDGRRYAIGGQVAIDASPIDGDPEATIQKLEIVRRAALAPAEPSGADRAIAAAATAGIQQAQAQLAAQRQQERQETLEDGEPGVGELGANEPNSGEPNANEPGAAADAGDSGPIDAGPSLSGASNDDDPFGVGRFGEPSSGLGGLLDPDQIRDPDQSSRFNPASVFGARGPTGVASPQIISISV